MNIELGKLPNGNMVILSDSAFPAEVARVEYYRDQRLLMLVYDDEHEGDLMQYELNESSRKSIETSPCAVVVTAEPGKEMFGYDVPIIQVGDLY
ncbi:MAG: hypothetical protein EOM26_02185 [Alphaproteobacteria bacterium]|nr:hypothetical protein [Alphaproteobacteria bacterium]